MRTNGDVCIYRLIIDCCLIRIYTILLPNAPVFMTQNAALTESQEIENRLAVET